MILTLLLLLALVVLVVVVALVVVWDSGDRRSRLVERWAGEEHARTLALGEKLIDAHELASARLAEASQREATNIDFVLGALRDERRQLLSAVLASNSADPLAGRRFGLMEASMDRPPAAPPMSPRDLMERMMDRQPADNEFLDNDGHPIIPVGMG